MIRPRDLPDSIVAQLVPVSAFLHSLDPTRTFRIQLANRHEPKTSGAGMALGSKTEGRRHLRTNGPLAIVFRSTQLGICAGRQPQHYQLMSAITVLGRGPWVDRRLIRASFQRSFQVLH